jgi:branched-chain amino acid transport system permease protein
VAAFLAAVVICGALWLWLNRSRAGMSLRAIAVGARRARLVGIDVPRCRGARLRAGRRGDGLGGGADLDLPDARRLDGVIFTLKALIIVIMGGVGDVRGTIVAALLLGVVETFVAS